MKFRHHLLAVALLGFTSGAFALEIEIRYDHDPNGFFANNPAAKTALRAAADFYEPLIHDSLTALDANTTPAGYSWTARIENPTTGATGYLIPGVVVPANTIVIFASGRALGGAAGRGGPGAQNISGDQNWANLVRYRGQAGANPSNGTVTDFGPWGGFVAFDTGMTWNFSLTDPAAPGQPFLSAALHEIGHVLGIGSTTPSWTNKVSGSNFTGAYAKQVYGGNVPLDTASPGHWRNDNEANDEPGVPSKAFGSFGTPHGSTQVGLMDPDLSSGNAFHLVVTDLDLAALRDIGWQIDPPPKLTVPNLKPSATPFVFSWPSTSGFTYRLQRSSELAPNSWTDLSTQAGNGLTQQFSSSTAGFTKIFYRLTTDVPAAGAWFVEPHLLQQPSAGNHSREVMFFEDAPVAVEGCGCGAHGLHQ